MKDIGKNIRALREQKGLTQEELAGRLFVTRQTLSNYETGRTRPDLDMLERLSQELDQELTTLIYGPPTSKAQRQQQRRLLWGGVLTVLALALVLLAHHLDRAWATYDLRARVLGSLVCQPLFWLLLGWTLLQAVLLLTRSKPLSGPWASWVRRGLLGLLALYALLVLPQMGAFVFGQEGSFSLGLTLDRWLMGLTRFLMRFPAVFLPVGGALGLWGFPVRPAPTEEGGTP